MFFHFERHDSDGNDNSIIDVVVEAATLEDAEDVLVKENPGWEQDRASEALELYKSYGEEQTYFKTFFLQGEYDDLSKVKRGRFHGYEEILA